MIAAYARRIFATGIVVMSGCSLFTYLGKFHRLFELTTHFRLQYWLGAFVAVIVMSFWRQWRWVAPAVLVLVLNSIHLYPWVITSGMAISTSPTGKLLKLAQVNVQYRNTQYDRMVAYLKNADRDIVILQEVNQEWVDRLVPIREIYPYSQIEARPTGSGIAVYSKLPFEKVETLHLGAADRPGIHIQFKLGDKIVNLITFHPLTPILPAKFAGSTKETAAIAELVAQTAAPKILIGDFNDTMFSHRHSQLLAKTQMRNVRSTAGSVIIPTWPSWLYFHWLMIPIDHCLVSDDIFTEVARSGGANGSDHLPLEVNLVLTDK